MEKKVQIVTFKSPTLAPEAASVMFRRAVGDIPAFRDSFLGNKPKVFDKDDDFDWIRHKKMRKFTDDKTLREYYEYLIELVGQTKGPHPQITTRNSILLIYTVASGLAEISIISVGGKWIVSGTAKFRNCEIAVKSLQKEGFSVTVR